MAWIALDTVSSEFFTEGGPLGEDLVNRVSPNYVQKRPETGFVVLFSPSPDIFLLSLSVSQHHSLTSTGNIPVLNFRSFHSAWHIGKPV